MHHEIPQMSLDQGGCPTFPCISVISGLHHLGMCLSQFPDEQYYPDPVHNHDKGFSLGQSLLSLEEVTGGSHSPDHHCGPVAIVVEGGMCSTGTLKLDDPQHGCPILLIEHVWRFNEDKPQPSSC